MICILVACCNGATMRCILVYSPSILAFFTTRTNWTNLNFCKARIKVKFVQFGKPEFKVAWLYGIRYSRCTDYSVPVHRIPVEAQRGDFFM